MNEVETLKNEIYQRLRICTNEIISLVVKPKSKSAIDSHTGTQMDFLPELGMPSRTKDIKIHSSFTKRKKPKLKRIIGVMFTYGDRFTTSNILDVLRDRACKKYIEKIARALKDEGYITVVGHSNRSRIYELNIEKANNFKNYDNISKKIKHKTKYRG